MNRSRLILMSVLAAPLACNPASIDGPVSGPPTGRRLSVGEATVCALDSAGTVYCWGNNSIFQEYGADSATIGTSASPVAVPMPPLAVISGGTGQHMCGILPSRQALCWGRGQSGQLGRGTAGDEGNAVGPVQPVGVAWTDVYVSRLTTCGLTLAGAGYCWGLNQRGEVGNSSLSVGAMIASPTPITHDGVIFQTIVPGWTHTCAIATNGALYCWGDNSSGQLGIGVVDGENHIEPLLVSFTERFIQVSLGARSTCGITIDHRALCWGFNGNGQLGDGTTTRRTFPTPVIGGLKFTRIALGSGFAGGTDVTLPPTGQASWAHTCALTESGAPYCWGWNGAGQVGDGTTTTQLAPVPVQGNLTLTSITAGGSSTCGMNGNAIWCWGSNLFGQLGNGTKINSSTPVAVTSPFDKPSP